MYKLKLQKFIAQDAEESDLFETVTLVQISSQPSHSAFT